MNAGQWRDGRLSGGKYGLMEGSTRVPFIVSWPGHTERGDSSALVSQIDLARSLAELAGAIVPEGALPDSRNQLPALLGKDRTGAPHIIESTNGGPKALRYGQYKYYRQGKKEHLYDLSNDLQELNNIAQQHPDIVEQMNRLLTELIDPS